jgi:hypothetical protein
MSWRSIPGLITLGASALTASFPIRAAEPPVVAIVIDDLGHSLETGLEVISLPGPVACSILPHTPSGAELAQRCHAEGKEVMLHLPMQPADPSVRPGAGALEIGHGRRELTRRLEAAIAAVPHASGVNNHMGSLLTRHLAPMQWLMEHLGERRDLFFIDSFTTPATVALRVARSNGLRTARRDVFLDSSTRLEDIRLEFARLKQAARQRGFALAIGHPYPQTIAVLEDELPRLREEGIMLVSVNQMIRRTSKESAPWLAYSSPSLPVSKR